MRFLWSARAKRAVRGFGQLAFLRRIAAAAGIRTRKSAGRGFGALAAATASAGALNGPIGLMSDESYGCGKAKSDDQGIHVHGKTSCGNLFLYFY